MKRVALLAAGIMLLAVWAAASPATSMDGWISDAKCGAKGANAGHAQCAKKCVPIDNPSAVAGHEGQHVKVTGTLTASGAVHVDKVTELAN
jgi:hypothetical protein